MKTITLSLLFSMILFADAAFALTGREIMEKNDALKKPDSSIQKNVLLIIKGDREEKKEMESLLADPDTPGLGDAPLEGQDAHDAPPSAGTSGSPMTRLESWNSQRAESWTAR